MIIRRLAVPALLATAQYLSLVRNGSPGSDKPRPPLGAAPDGGSRWSRPSFRTRLAVYAAAAAVFAPLLAADPSGVALVADGKPAAAIVAADELSPSEQWAVKELQKFVAEMSGAKLAVVKPGQEPAGLAPVYVGNKTAKAKFPDLDLKDLGEEGFIIKTVGNALVVAGGERRGTMYGVYALLESLGCRWWTPTESLVPASKTIVIPATDRRETPKLEYRGLLYGELFSRAGFLWCARNRINSVASEPLPEEFGGRYFVAGSNGHNTTKLVAAAVGGKDKIKPEMWTLAKGRDGQLSRSHDEVCMAHPEVVAATVDSLVKLYREYPDTRYLVLAHEDNNAYCRCPECAALVAKEGSPTGLWIPFVNQVAEGLEKKVPGARVMVDAYGWTRTAPKTVKPRANVMVRFAPIESNWAYPLASASTNENRQVGADIKAWSEAASALSIWSYVGNRAHYLMPNPDLDAMLPNIKFFRDHKAMGVFNQGTHAGVATEFVALRMWTQAKALWNPDLDGQALIGQFLREYYGPAAPHIQEYIEVMHRWGRENQYKLARVTRMNVPFLQPQIIAQAERVLRQADRIVANDPVFARRVRHAHMPIWYILAKRGPDSPTWKTVAKLAGQLDFAILARDLNQVAQDYKISAVADPEKAGPWFEWLTDYATRLARQGQVLPPELKPAQMRNVRLIQARQIDSSYLEREGQWRKMDDASDGWVLRVISPRWLVQHHFSPYDEYAVGKTYTLHLRVKGGEKKGDGRGLVCGLSGPEAGGKLPSLEVPAADLADGRFHVVTLGPFTPGDAFSLYLATSRDNAMPELFFDCMWLEEAGK